MRTIHLFWDRPNGQLVQGLNSSSPLGAMEVGQEDKLQFVIHNTVISDAVPAVVPYVEKPLDFSSARASIGQVDGAPNRGTFKMRVVDQTTTALTWPASLSTAGEIATWKAAVLTALKALSNVGNDGIASADAADTKGHFFFFRWTDPGRTDVIQVVENQLLPLARAEQSAVETDFGYTQLVKLTQFPVAMTSNFARPSSPEVTVITTQVGGAGVNAEQTIVVPTAATGSVAFARSGAQTNSLAVATLSAAAIAAALNSVVADGETNPSFAVEERPSRSGRRLAVTFIGPLAGAAQDLLEVTMIDQESVPYAVGTLDLMDFKVGIELALNGNPYVDLPLELVIVQNGEETIFHTLRIINDMTSGETEEDAAEAGAVTVREIEVVVDNSTTEAFASVAPGASFSPPEAVSAGAGQSVAHNLGSRHAWVRVQYQTSIEPERWRDLQRGGEFDWVNTDENHVTLNIVYAISDDEDDDFYRERFKVYISSPDAVMEIFGALSFTWAQCLASLPGGQSVAAKFAAIDAALGIVAGDLRVAAGNITGQLSPGQIDVSALAAGLKENGAFLTTLQALAGDPLIAQALGTALGTSVNFSTSLKTLLGTFDVLGVISGGLLANNVFATGMRTLIAEIIQGTAGALGNMVTWRLPDWNDLYPSAVAGTLEPLPAAVFLAEDLGTLAGVYLPPPSASNAGKRYTIGASGARSRAATGAKRRQSFAAGAVVFSTGLDWYEADEGRLGTFTADAASNVITLDQPHFREIGDRVRVTTSASDLPAGLVINTDYWVLTKPAANTMTVSLTSGGSVVDITDAGTGTHVMITGAHYAREFERELFTLEVNDQQLALGTRFAVLFSFSLAQEGNCEGFYRFTLLRGTPNATRASNTNLSTITTVETVIDVPIVVTDALNQHTFGYAVERSLTNVLTATKQIYTKTGIAAVAPGSAKFTLRGLLSRFDVQDVSAPVGQLKLITPAGQLASIVALET